MVTVVENKKAGDVFRYLPLLALCVDLTTPYLIWQHIIPAQIRWISDLLIAVVMLLVVFRMLAFKRIPGAAWLFLGVVVLWSYVAVGHGQGLAATLWGVWRLIEFPIIALFVYLEPDVWVEFPSLFRRYGLGLLVVQAAFQLAQYFSGMAPGDNLAGLFGPHGTGPAVIFMILVCSSYFGYWITTKKWLGLLAALVLSAICSVLGEIKFFPLATGAIGAVALVIYATKYRARRTALVVGSLIAVTMLGFLALYNSLVPTADRAPLQSYLMDPARLTRYLNLSERLYVNGAYVTNMGRNFAIQVGWEALNKDPITLLFGYGIGSRGESRTLGTAGVGLRQGTVGLSSGTSLLVQMQELGVVGLAVLGTLFIWMAAVIARDIRRYPTASSNHLRYALLFFTALWPLWLWYTGVWTMRAPMILYWFAIGYIFAESRAAQMQEQPAGLVPAEA
jgi:hypothetical protein